MLSVAKPRFPSVCIAYLRIALAHKEVSRCILRENLALAHDDADDVRAYNDLQASLSISGPGVKI